MTTQASFFWAFKILLGDDIQAPNIMMLHELHD